MIGARANWERTLLVCGKCSRKADGGFGPRGERLAKALRRLPGFGKGRKARVGVIETKCLGFCPKRAVTIVDAARPGRWWVVKPGEDVAAVARALGIADQA